MSATKSATQSTKRKSVKPLNPNEFVKESVRYSNLKNNTELGLKWIDINYSRDGAGTDDKLLVVARGCIIKAFGKLENKSKDGKPRKDKFSIFMSIKDNEFIDMINTFEHHLEKIGSDNALSWFDNDMTEEECHDMLKSCAVSYTHLRAHET